MDATGPRVRPLRDLSRIRARSRDDSLGHPGRFGHLLLRVAFGFEYRVNAGAPPRPGHDPHGCSNLHAPGTHGTLPPCGP